MGDKATKSQQNKFRIAFKNLCILLDDGDLQIKYTTFLYLMQIPHKKMQFALMV